jgi:hypothetical protein
LLFTLLHDIQELIFIDFRSFVENGYTPNKRISRHKTSKMSTSAIVSVRNIDVNQVSFVVGQAKNGRNPTIAIKYAGQNLQLRLPRMKFPGGVLIRESDQNESKTYTLIGSLNGCDPYGKDRASETDDVSRFYNFLLDLENKIVAAAVEGSVKWFGKKRSEEAIRDGFKKLMRMSVDKVDGEYIPNGKYPPSVTVKVPVYDNRVNTEVVDNRGNPMTVYPNSLPSAFPKGVEANLVVSGSIYTIAGGGFGVTWRLSYAQVFPLQRMTAASVFADDIENDDTEATQEATEVEPTQQQETETPQEEEAPAPAPAKATGRRRVAAGPPL